MRFCVWRSYLERLELNNRFFFSINLHINYLDHPLQTNPLKDFLQFSELIGLAIDLKSGEISLPVLCGFCIISVRKTPVLPLSEWLRKPGIATHLLEWIMLPCEDPHRKGLAHMAEMH